MKLFEITIPTLENILDTKYPEKILRRNYWVKHGSYIDDYIERVKYDSGFPEQLTDMPADEIIKHPDFQQYFYDFVEKRKRYAYNNLVNDIKKSTIISRQITVSSSWVKKFKTKSGTLNIGIYWSIGRADLYQADMKKEHVVSFTADINNVSVEWRNTLESRMDYMYGDDESEIQLVKNSPIIMNKIELDGELINYSNWNFVA